MHAIQNISIGIISSDLRLDHFESRCRVASCSFEGLEATFGE